MLHVTSAREEGGGFTSTEVDNETWIINEIYNINVKRSNSFAGCLQPAFHLLDEEKQIIILKYPIQEWQRSLYGNVSSLIVDSMIKLSMGLAVSCFSGRRIPITITGYTEFKRRVIAGDFVVVETAISSVGQNSASAMSFFYDTENGKVAAKANGMFRLA